MAADEVVSVREGVLENVCSLKVVSCHDDNGLISPEEIYVTLVAIRTPRLTSHTPVIGIIPPSYCGRRIILESRRVSFDEQNEICDQKLFVAQFSAGGVYRAEELITESSIFKVKNEYLSLDSLLRM
ncbi:MAG: hypothetical protein AABX24_06070 [Nanoarchaeota archaeon]